MNDSENTTATVPSLNGQRQAMSARDASWNIEQAAQKERADAARLGGDPAAVQALMGAAMASDPASGCPDTVVIGGIVLHHYNLKILVCLQKLDSAYVQDTGGKAQRLDALDIALGALCYSEPDKVWTLLRAGQRTEVEDMAFALAGKLTISVMQDINRFINGEFASFEQPEPEATPGKQEAPATLPDSTTAAAPPADGCSPT